MFTVIFVHIARSIQSIDRFIYTIRYVYTWYDNHYTFNDNILKLSERFYNIVDGYTASSRNMTSTEFSPDY